jgi:hypothetical protein
MFLILAQGEFFSSCILFAIERSMVKKIHLVNVFACHGGIFYVMVVCRRRGAMMDFLKSIYLPARIPRGFAAG